MLRVEEDEVVERFLAQRAVEPLDVRRGTTIGVVGYVNCEFKYEIAANGVWSLKPDPKQQCPASGPGSFDYFDTGTLKQQGDILAIDAEGSECCFLSDIPSVSFVATLTRSP
ncbi:MAG: hypothetical protein WBP56_17745 [Polyangia bacterium]